MHYVIRELAIKNMICTRCLKVIQENLESVGVEVLEVKLGWVKIRYPEEKFTIDKIGEYLEKDDFEVVKNPNEIISEEVKQVLLGIVRNLPIVLTKKLSEIIAEALHKDYWSLSRIFSRTKGITIEHYFILLRVEKAKELMEYNELNFSEIAYELGYGSLNHLSNQFKQVTGMSMTQYKELRQKPRVALDKILQTLTKKRQDKIQQVA